MQAHLRRLLEPLLTHPTDGVQLYLAGHEHLFEVTPPIRQGQVCRPDQGGGHPYDRGGCRSPESGRTARPAPPALGSSGPASLRALCVGGGVPVPDLYRERRAGCGHWHGDHSSAWGLGQPLLGRQCSRSREETQASPGLWGSQTSIIPEGVPEVWICALAEQQRRRGCSSSIAQHVR
jgi:hypothetical protein